MAEPLRIGNCSGFYGDRFSAMREMLEGAPDGQGLDVLTGDYLAELTMLILGKDALKDPSLGYARTFVRQLEDGLGTALERGGTMTAAPGWRRVTSPWTSSRSYAPSEVNEVTTRSIGRSSSITARE